MNDNQPDPEHAPRIWTNEELFVARLAETFLDKDALHDVRTVSEARAVYKVYEDAIFKAVEFLETTSRYLQEYREL